MLLPYKKKVTVTIFSNTGFVQHFLWRASLKNSNYFDPSRAEPIYSWSLSRVCLGCETFLVPLLAARKKILAEPGQGVFTNYERRFAHFRSYYIVIRYYLRPG